MSQIRVTRRLATAAVVSLFAAYSATAHADGFTSPPTKLCKAGSSVVPVPDYFTVRDCYNLNGAGTGLAGCFRPDGSKAFAASANSVPSDNDNPSPGLSCGWKID